QICFMVMWLLIIFNCWFLYIPYLAWMYLDWRTPEQGGRKSTWVQSWTVWKHFNDYFPIRLIKTQDLDPGHNYIFGYHPHGILVAGAFGNFCTSYSDFKKLFPGLSVYSHILPLVFGCPFFREYVLSTGLVSVSRRSVSYVLSKQGGGNVSMIILGGAQEALVSNPGRFTVFIRQRKGFVRLALIHGASLVPLFSFGEIELFKQINNTKGSWLRTIQDIVRKYTGLALPIFYGRGIFQYNFGIMPYRKPIHTVVGRPIHVQQTPHPTPEQVDELHQTYMEELKALFDKHKGKYGIPEHETLTFT
uniref:Acyltransferase n=2 Tax=Jaculus jaculus TaxID=51337 RepID=A0A8C5LG46_JACJA